MPFMDIALYMRLKFRPRVLVYIRVSLKGVTLTHLVNSRLLASNGFEFPKFKVLRSL